MGRMRVYNKIIVSLASTLFIISCASTSITSFKEPTFTGKTFQRMLVAVAITDIGERTLVEQTISTQLAKYGVTGIPSLTFILPTRTYTADEVDKLLIDNNIDSVLILELTGKDVVTGIASFPSQRLNVFEHRWETVSNVYSYRKPRAYYSLKLYDVTTDKLVWVASTRTGGNAYARFSTLVDSLADTVITKMQEDGLLE